MTARSEAIFRAILLLVGCLLVVGLVVNVVIRSLVTPFEGTGYVIGGSVICLAWALWLGFLGARRLRRLPPRPAAEVDGRDPGV